MIDCTIIIPVYNRRYDLIKSLKAISELNGLDYEIIIVDDGSIDPSDCDVESVNVRCRKIRKRNGGLASARNTGIDAAVGSYIYFLDAGDEPVHNLGEYVQSVMASGCDIGVCSWTYSSPQSGDVVVDLAKSVTNITLDIIMKNVAPVHSFLVKRSALSQHRFDVTYKYVEDWNLWLRLFESGVTVKCFRDYMAHYEVTGDSMSLNTLGMAISYCRNINDYKLSLDRQDDEKVGLAAVSYTNQIRLVWNQIRFGNLHKVQRYISECFRCGYPSLLYDLPITLIVDKLRRIQLKMPN